MTTPKIVAVAIAAAEAASGKRMPEAQAAALYRYAVERKFPPAETLARKYGELVGDPFRWPLLEEAPAPVQLAFTAFRAVILGMKPLAEMLESAAAALPQVAGSISGTLLEETDSASVDELRDMAKLGHALMKEIALATAEGELMEGWTPKESPHEIVRDLVEMNERAHKAALQALETADKALMALKAGGFAPDAGDDQGGDQVEAGKAADLPTAEDRLPPGDAPASDTPAEAKTKRK